MEIAVGLLVALLGAVIVAWRVEVSKSATASEKLVTAALVAESATETTRVLAERVQERDDEIEELVKYIAEDTGVSGLADLLNAKLHKNSEGGDDDGGMPN
jgi:hypothetical protein